MHVSVTVGENVMPGKVTCSAENEPAVDNVNYHRKWCEDNERRRLMQHETDLAMYREELLTAFKFIAAPHGYEVSTGGNPWMHAFRKKGVQVYIYHSASSMLNRKYTVTTQITHPKRGRTQLHRRHCTMKDINDILKCPRIHTSKGYYRKKNILSNL